MEDGGNAFDAAIAVSSVLTVLLPSASSAGGDGFLLAVDSGGDTVAYNGSGRSPKGFPVEQYLVQAPVRGPLTFTVPGLIDMWEWVNGNYGSMSLNRLLRRATSLAMNGFYVQERLAMEVESNRPALAGYDEWNRIFGSTRFGSKIRFPRLARIYNAVGNEGADAFYRSRLTEEVVEELRQQQVPVTYEDFAEHRGEKIAPIKCTYGNYELYELPPNTQGISTLQLLKLLEISELNRLPFRSPERMNRFLELALATYEDREKNVADPNYCVTPVDELLSPARLRKMLSKKFDTQLRLSQNDTTFFITADHYGNLVGFIESVFLGFGSGIVAHDIPFQSRGAGFAKRDGLPNSPAPQKRPLHTLSILLAHASDKCDYMIGCTAGDLRPQVHAEIFTNVAEYDMSLSSAVDAPRYMLTSWGEGEMHAIAEDEIWDNKLHDWVSKVGYRSPKTGIAHAARRGPNGVLELVADPRGGGVALPLV